MADITLNGIVKRFGATPVLKGVTLQVEHGRFVSMLGPSGCGKTTLLRIIAGLEAQDEGDVFIGGRMVDDLAPKDRDIAFVFQSYALYPYMSVAQNIGLPLTMRRLSAAQRLPLVGRFLPGTADVRDGITREVEAMARSLEIGQLLQRKPGQLSGGQRQRVALARAMVRQPAVFLMDEPLSNLDAKLRVQARAEIADLHRRLGATFVYVTHDQAEAMTMSDEVAVMLDGELVQVAPPRQLYADPADLRVARFIGSHEIAVIRAEIRADGGLTVAGRSVGVGVMGRGGGPAQLGVRAEAADLADAGLPARVRHVEHLGSDMMVHCEIEGVSAPVIARADPHAHPHVGVGQQLHVRLRPARLLAFDAEGRRLPLAPSPADAPARVLEAVRG